MVHLIATRVLSPGVIRHFLKYLQFCLFNLFSVKFGTAAPKTGYNRRIVDFNYLEPVFGYKIDE